MELIHTEFNKEQWLTSSIRLKLNPKRAYRCKDCKKKIYKLGEFFERVELHHIIPLSRGGITKGNLVKLCFQCHQERHDKLNKKPELPLFRKGVSYEQIHYGRIHPVGFSNKGKPARESI